ncbi:MAG TPA: hypothetical protein VF173_14175, partial [Thermoanaerobaculia bacterium]|nr:hypothetical protein [Thermoanaerobaculia bacterium]
LSASSLTAAAPAGAGDLAPFVGTWSGDWNPGPGSNGKFRALDLEIRPGGKIVETWYRYQKQDDGTVKTSKTSHAVTKYKVSGQTLLLTTHVASFKFERQPPGPTDIEESLELQGKDEAVFKALSNSLLAEAKRKGGLVPPEPPPIAMKRRS